MKNNIHLKRKEHGMSQQELAERVNVTRQTINAVENNKYDPSLKLAMNIAKVFKVSVEELFIE